MAKLIAYLKARPAIVAALVSIAGTVGADFGMHLTPVQLATVLSVLNALLGVLVHTNTVPASQAQPVQHGDHEKPGGGS